MLPFWKGKGTKAFSPWWRAPYEEIKNLYSSITRAPRQWPGGIEAIACVASQVSDLSIPPLTIQAVVKNTRLSHQQAALATAIAVGLFLAKATAKVVSARTTLLNDFPWLNIANMTYV